MFIVLHAAPFTLCAALGAPLSYYCSYVLYFFPLLSWCNDRLANLALLNFGCCDIQVTGVVLDQPKKGLNVYLISWILTAYTLISWILTIYRVSVSLTLSA